MGDGLHAVFSVDGDAVAAAVDGQLALAAEPWAEELALREVIDDWAPWEQWPPKSRW